VLLSSIYLTCVTMKNDRIIGAIRIISIIRKRTPQKYYVLRTFPNVLRFHSGKYFLFRLPDQGFHMQVLAMPY